MHERPLRDVDELLGLLAATATADDDEHVTVLEHGLQCAHHLATTHPDDLELQVAGLVHDVGWFARDAEGRWAPTADARHDAVGAARVRDLLGERVARLVGGHVEAKRYLVTTEAGYDEDLSDRSTTTLAFQGGRLDAAAVTAFDARPDRDDLLALRRADEAGKDPAARVPPLEAWHRALTIVADARPR